MIAVTAVIITFDERENIERTLDALQWVRSVLIVDSCSTDGTTELAQSSHANVRVLRRPFDSFAAQCNFALAQVDSEWVLSIDADYVITKDLATEISALSPPKDVAGYCAAFSYHVFGRPLRTTIYPPRTVLYRKALARYEDEGHGHRVTVAGDVRHLLYKIDHDDRKPLSRWIRSQDHYSVVEARHLLSVPKATLTAQDRLRLRIYVAPAVMFFYLLFIKRFLLDGWPGWYYVMQRTVAEMLLSLRLLTEKHGLEDRRIG